jgi:hypothetical protein
MRKTKIIIGTLLTTATLALASPAMASVAEPAAPASASSSYYHGPYASVDICNVFRAHAILIGTWGYIGPCEWTTGSGSNLWTYGWYFYGG